MFVSLKGFHQAAATQTMPLNLFVILTTVQKRGIHMIHMNLQGSELSHHIIFFKYLFKAGMRSTQSIKMTVHSTVRI